jgi:hypothetical protein
VPNSKVELFSCGNIAHLRALMHFEAMPCIIAISGLFYSASVVQTPIHPAGADDVEAAITTVR